MVLRRVVSPSFVGAEQGAVQGVGGNGREWTAMDAGPHRPHRERRSSRRGNLPRARPNSGTP